MYIHFTDFLKKFKYLEHLVNYKGNQNTVNNTNDVKSFLELLIDNLAGVVQYDGRYPVDMVEVCSVMTDEGLGEPLDRLAVVNDMMLEMNAEECLDHTYATFLADITTTEWATDGSFVPFLLACPAR